MTYQLEAYVSVQSRSVPSLHLWYREMWWGIITAALLCRVTVLQVSFQNGLVSDYGCHNVAWPAGRLSTEI